MTDLASVAKVIAEPVARELWGEPVPGHSKPGVELRWGSGGSKSLDLKKGTWFDHEAGEGGGVLDLVKRELGTDQGGAIDWLKAHGYLADEPRQERPQRRESAPAASGNARQARELVATYDYTDAAGTLLYQVCRFRLENGKKSFAQRRPDGRGGWIWNLEGIAHGLYRLPKVADAVADDALLFLVEGEKDVESLERWGVPATTNSGGAKHWSPDHARHLAGADVVIIPDNDDAGREGAQIKAKALHGVARCVRILDLAKEVPALEQKGDVTDWAERHGGNADALYEMAARAPVWKPTTERLSRLKPVTWDRLDAKGDAHEWLVKGLMTRGELSMLAGPSQSGKSFLAIDLACSVARGIPWFGRKVKQGGVVYQAGESAKGVRRKRLPAYRARHRCAADDVPFALLQAPVNLHASDDDTQAMIEECLFWREAWGSLELVVIDTFSAATPGANENASEDMSRVLARCGRIAEATGAAVLLVHHMNALGEKPRGHTSIFANLDSVLLCRKDAERRDADNRQIREMKVAKAKDGEADWSLRFVLPAIEIGRDEDGDPVTSCVVDEPNMGLLNEPPPDAKPARLSDKPFNYLKAIKSALDEHGITAGEAKVELPVGTMVVHRKHVAAAYAAAWQGEEEDPEKQAQNMRAARMRLGEKLLAGGYIGSAQPWLWLLSRGEAAVTPRRRNVTDEGGGVTGEGGHVTPGGDPVTHDPYDDTPEFAR